jgi:hypothetical protein
MLNPNFVILGVIIGGLGGLSYIVDTLKGKAKPNRVSWLLWAVAPLIAFFAEIKQGVGIQSLMTFSVGFIPLVVFLASFVNKKSVWKIRRFDIICGALSLTGLAFWYITRVANTAIVFSIIADCLAGLPTVVKSYNHPETENYWLYLASSTNSTITLLTISLWNFANFGFPLYNTIFCLIVVVLIKFKLKKFVKNQT